MRWIAVRHGADHIHIVAMLARQDGRRWRLDFEKKRVREACLAAEERYGLKSTAPGDSTAARRPSRAETEKAARRGLDEAAAGHAAPPGHHRRRRRVAATASSSPAWRRPGSWSGSGSAPGTPARSPGTRSRCPATPARTAGRCGSAAASSPPT